MLDGFMPVRDALIALVFIGVDDAVRLDTAVNEVMQSLLVRAGDL